MRLAALLLCALAITVVISGCAPGPNRMAGIPDDSGHVAGFLIGFWHGFISLFTFIVSLFDRNVRVYEVHNSGALYDLGFLLGVIVFFGGGGGGATSASRRGKKGRA